MLPKNKQMKTQERGSLSTVKSDVVLETSPCHSTNAEVGGISSHISPDIWGKFRIFTNLSNNVFLFDVGHPLVSLIQPLLYKF